MKWYLCYLKRQVATGFTLIELLVVMAIISLLVSILLPSLNKAKELACQTVCLSNLRVLNSAIFSYTSDYQGRLPLYSYPNWAQPTVWTSLATYLDVSVPALPNGISQYSWDYPFTGAMVCPEVSRTATHKFSYAYNLLLSAVDCAIIPSPAITPTFFDCQNTFATAPLIWQGSGNQWMVPTLCHPANIGINFSFADGHAANFTPEDWMDVVGTNDFTDDTYWR